jgi:hypothetical protein
MEVYAEIQIKICIKLASLHNIDFEAPPKLRDDRERLLNFTNKWKPKWVLKKMEWRRPFCKSFNQILPLERY